MKLARREGAAQCSPVFRVDKPQTARTFLATELRPPLSLSLSLDSIFILG